MLNKSFGIHVEWARRWMLRLYAHRASYDGEATILRALEPDLAPESLRTLLESAWIRYQLWSRAAEMEGIQLRLATQLLESPLEELLQHAAVWYLPLMQQRRYDAWTNSGDRMDICAIDGNAKLHRRACGAPCAEAVYSESLGLHLVRGCPNSPVQRGVLCARHRDLAAQTTLVEQIEAHRMVAPLASLPFLELQVKPAGCLNWQPACTMAADVVQAYFASHGAQVC